jgi:hypothetical protein
MAFTKHVRSIPSAHAHDSPALQVLDKLGSPTMTERLATHPIAAITHHMRNASPAIVVARRNLMP